MSDMIITKVTRTHRQRILLEEDGEIKEFKSRRNNIPEGKEEFNSDELFAKSYVRAWAYLFDKLSSTELKIALKMSNMTEINTNSLAPLDNKSSIRELADYFNISKNSVNKAFMNLFKMGVYAEFKYCHYKRGLVSEWVFNPYISYKGKLIDSDIKNLFDNTEIGKVFAEDNKHKYH